MLTPPHSTPGSPPDSCSLLMSKLLLLSIRFTQLFGMSPLILLTLMFNRWNSELVLPQASGSVPVSLLLLRSRVNTGPGANAASRLGGKVPAGTQGATSARTHCQRFFGAGMDVCRTDLTEMPGWQRQPDSD